MSKTVEESSKNLYILFYISQQIGLWHSQMVLFMTPKAQRKFNERFRFIGKPHSVPSILFKRTQISRFICSLSFDLKSQKKQTNTRLATIFSTQMEAESASD